MIHPVDALEQDALGDTSLLPTPLEDFDLRVQMSIAISLKRIADLLDGSTLGICVTETIFNTRQR